MCTLLQFAPWSRHSILGLFGPFERFHPFKPSIVATMPRVQHAYGTSQLSAVTIQRGMDAAPRYSAAR